MRKFIWITLLSIVFLHLGFRIIQYWPRYIQDLDGEYWKDRYFQSQWVVTDSKNPIGDDGLYAYHGYELVLGGDPTVINRGSATWQISHRSMCPCFRNNNIFGLFTGLFCLLTFYFLTGSFSKTDCLPFSRLLFFTRSVVLFTAAGIISGHIISLFPFSDVLFFLRKKFFIAMIFLGCFASVKFSALAILSSLPVWFIYYFRRGERILSVLSQT